MVLGMTGYGIREARIKGVGKVRVELRSVNHKFLDIVFHLPGGILFLEEKIKKEIESKLQRGRLTCAINIIQPAGASVFINKDLLKNYINTLKDLKSEFRLQGEVDFNALIHLPGVLSLEEEGISRIGIWPQLRPLVAGAVDDVVTMRRKEGQALAGFLQKYTRSITLQLGAIRTRFKKVIETRVRSLASDVERSVFLKEVDISEEMERLLFHIHAFQQKLRGRGAAGKELDFIAQEMQREANTMAAKSCDASLSWRAVQIKSQIEKIREQVQNIE
ncbi:MAG: YicC family protein [Candidatus Omnitrophica bacterium]|nr:YicC family protein [Candidatus Omnitrophota bacterium]